MKTLLLVALIFSAEKIFSEPFKTGHYYDHQGKRIDGLIKFNRASFSGLGYKPSHIKFKSGKDASPTELSIDQVQSFVIEKDSFTIISNIRINSFAGEYPKDFVKVLHTGPVKLYLHQSAGSTSEYSYHYDVYVLARGANEQLVVWNFVKQRKEMAEFFGDSPSLVEKIIAGEFDKNIIGLVKEFNQTISQ